MELVKLDAPDPMGVVSPSYQWLDRGTNVPESETAVVTRCGKVVLLVGVEVQRANSIVT